MDGSGSDAGPDPIPRSGERSVLCDEEAAPTPPTQHHIPGEAPSPHSIEGGVQTFQCLWAEVEALAGCRPLPGKVHHQHRPPLLDGGFAAEEPQILDVGIAPTKDDEELRIDS